MATTEPRLASHRGSEYWRSTRCVGQLLDLLGVDPGDGAGEQPAGLDQLGGDHPARRLLRQRRAGRDHEPGVAGAEVLPARPAGLAVRPFAGSGLQADVRQQPGQQRGGDALLVGLGGGLAERHAQPAGGAAQLAVQVLPLADAQVVQELPLHRAAELVAATARPAARRGSARG